MIYVQSMDSNKLGQMLGLGYGDFLVDDAIFLTEKGKPHLRVRDFTKLPIRDYVTEIVAYYNGGIEGRWLFFGKDSDDSRMKCLESVLDMDKVNVIKRSSELYEFVDRVSIEIREIHTDLYYAIPWI